MEWQDDEFEAFLRQFQPVKPKALPNRRRAVVALSAAAVLLAAVAIPTRVWRAATPETPATLPAVSLRPESSATTGQPVQTDLLKRPTERSDSPAVSSLPTLSPGSRAPSRAGSPPVAERSRAGSAAPRRIRVGGEVKPPFRIVNVNPVYPEEAKAAGIQGVVILDCVIGEDGTVIETLVLESVPELDQAAIDAVMQWLYEPTLLNGEPVEVEMTVTITFTLR
jgi:TonB family protein